ncbi:MAG: hypothetical protein ACYC19_05105 [Acidimicrobiales bacterium]
MSENPQATSWEQSYRAVPPVGWMTGGALLLVVIGGVYMASYAPRTAPLGVAIGLMAGGVALMIAAGVALGRTRDFAWRTFRKVFKWALLAYAISAAMIEFAFVRDQMRGASLLVVSVMLLVFASSVPATIAFTVARFADD